MIESINAKLIISSPNNILISLAPLNIDAS